MKRVGNLYDKIFEKENLRTAILKASTKKRKRKSVRRIIENMDKSIEYLQLNRCVTGKYKEKIRVDPACGKTRKILEPKFFPDQVLHHAIMQVLEPVFFKGMYKYCCGSVKGRGTLYASKYVRKILSKDPKGSKYFAKMDVNKYYDNVDHDILKTLLKAKIKDKEVLKLLFTIIDSVEIGIPIGNYTSQWFANFYLQGVDHYIKEELKISYYVRYMDDMVLISSNKRKLKLKIKKIKEYLQDKLKLQTKPYEKPMKVSPSSKELNSGTMFIDFCGFKHYRDKVTIRKRTWKRIRHIFFSINKKATLTKAKRFMSYYGAIKNSDNKTIFEKYFKLINFDSLKKIISKGENYAICIEK